MQDRFRYRVFDNDDRKMHDVIFLNYENNSVEWYNDNNKKRAAFIGEVPTLQCTGLKDKNGKLIYEGDIVKYKDEVYDLCIGRIKKDNAHYELQYYTGEKYGWFSHILFKQYIKNIEVVGNIYENPELLENN